MFTSFCIELPGLPRPAGGKANGLQPAKACEAYSAVPAEPAPAELLGIPSGSPVFAVERVTFLPGGKPFEFVQSIMRGDRYSIILELMANRVPQAMREGGTQ